MADKGPCVWETHTPAEPAMVIIVDEYAEMPEEPHDRADSIAHGRAVAVNLITASQPPSQKSMGKAQFGPRLITTTARGSGNAATSDLILGQGVFNAGWHAHALTRPGEFLVSHPGRAKPNGHPPT